MKLNPLDDRVVIKVNKEDEKSVGGIIIPDNVREKPNIGVVIAIGTDESLKELVKIGDKILYGKYGGKEVNLEGEKFLLVARADILAIIV